MVRIVIILLGIFLLFGGAHDAYNGWKNPEPIQMSVSDFINSDKSASWVNLHDAKLNLLKAVAVTSGKTGKVKQLYVPIESEEFFQEGKVKLLLDTSDKELLTLAQEMHDLSEAEQLKYVVQNRDKLLRNAPLSGTMVSHHAMSSERRKEMGELIKNLDQEFYLMNHGADVDLVRGLIISGVATLILLFGIFRKKKKKGAQAAAEAVA